MTNFVQIHCLTSYPPSLPNRDDMGRAKTVRFGDVIRQRIASQSLKYGDRNSPLIDELLGENRGTRSKRWITDVVAPILKASAADNETVASWLADLMLVLGKPHEKRNAKDPEKPRFDVKTLVFMSHHEVNGLMTFARALAAFLNGDYNGPLLTALLELRGLRAEREQAVKKASKKDKAKTEKRWTTVVVRRLTELLLYTDRTSIDIALYGRMLAEHPMYNVEAACQVAHAWTVHAAEIADDYFSAVDELNLGTEDHGAGHIDRSELGGGVYYQYICVNRDLLLNNLQGDEALTQQALRYVLACAAMVTPVGKQASHATRARASWIMVERGVDLPFSLCAAFSPAVRGPDVLQTAIKRIEDTSASFAVVYDGAQTERMTINVPNRTGTFSDLLTFCATTPEED